MSVPAGHGARPLQISRDAVSDLLAALGYPSVAAITHQPSYTHSADWSNGESKKIQQHHLRAALRTFKE